MFDIQATIKWVTAVLSDPDNVATSYRDTSPGWQQSFFQLTLPLYVGSYVVAGVLALITGGSLLLGSLSFGIFLFSLLWSLVWTFAIAYIFEFFSGMFDGKRGFDAAYAVIALAIVPAAAGSALAPLPWLGWLISLAGGIYSLMLAYRFLPVFLEVPEPARVKHFVLSIVAALVVNLIVSLTIGSMLQPSMIDESISTQSSQSTGGGVFGGFERQAAMVEEASSDVYDPPADSELSDAQVRRYVDVMEKTQQLQERLGNSMKEMEDKEPSLSDIFDGVGGAVRLSTAEMEVVKTGGGNWAEHQWVKAQLETARIQQDLNATTQHNYELFLKYQDEIEQLD
jgi:hypothetical protein